MPPIETNIIDVSRRSTSDSCRGYDWLGYRPFPKGLFIHRAQTPDSPYATLSGYFGGTCCPALTDMEVNHITAKGKRFVRVPGDSPSGWASGPVSAPYGDGLLFQNLYPYLCNVYGESCEILGRFNQPGSNITVEDDVSEETQDWLAQWFASRGHDYGIAYTDFPLVIAEGSRSYIIWHEEITFGTGKVCPGKKVKELTPVIIEKARAIMKAAQMSDTPTPPPVSDPAAMAPDGLPFPDGLDNGILDLCFGQLKQGTSVYSYNPAGPISKKWYVKYKTTGRFPFLYEHFKDSTNGREYFIFSDGAYVWRPSGKDAWRWS